MNGMFRGCTSLTGLQISAWDVSSVTDGSNFLIFSNLALSQAEYDATLKNWSQQPLQSGVTFHFGDATYTEEPIAVSLQIDGETTYADTDLDEEVLPFQWGDGTDPTVEARISTASTNTGAGGFVQVDDLADSSSEISPGSYSPGVNVPFNLASRNGSTFIQGAVDGTGLTENATPTVLPYLEATDLSVGATFMGHIGQLRQWNVDLTDAGIEEASSPPNPSQGVGYWVVGSTFEVA